VSEIGSNATGHKVRTIGQLPVLQYGI